MLNTILLVICATGLVLLDILLIIHMIHTKKAFNQVFTVVQQLSREAGIRGNREC